MLTLGAMHLFSGIGGGSLGFVRAGFESVGAFDSWQSACRNYEYFTGAPATCADLAKLEPADVARHCSARPDVVFTSPPCKGFSGCLPEARSQTAAYQDLNSLAFRGVWLALEAWRQPPPLLILENVPRIQTRGRAWLDRIVAMLRGYGYAVTLSTHCCGEIGGLAQRRKRFLLVARHEAQVPAWLRVPSSQRVRGIGEVLGELPCPVPGSTAGGPMHRLPELSALNWVRLALIPAGGDWRDLPPEVRLPPRDARQNGPWGVEQWHEASHAVLGRAAVRSTWAAVADPRSECDRREGSIGVTGWDQPSTSVIANGRVHNGPWQVADPRLRCEPRNGTFGVEDWARPSHAVLAATDVQAGHGSVADPRVPEVVGPELDLADRKPIHLVIRAADGTWHRPLTTLELAALQGFPTRDGAGEWLRLDGRSHRVWREQIGNAVPPPAAEAIARSCALTLRAAAGDFQLSNDPIWVSHLEARP